MIPILETQRLRLVAPSAALRGSLRAVLHRRSSFRWVRRPHLSLAQPGHVCLQISALGTSRALASGQSKRSSDGEYVGTCGFWQGRGWPRELTWWLLPRYRGQGLAKEASHAAVQHAYDVFRVRQP